MTVENEDKTYALIRRPGNRGLAARLTAEGGRIIEFPALLDAIDPDAGDESPAPDNFDWIVFPDGFAAAYFFERWAIDGRGLADMDALSIIALGEKAAEQLRSFSVHTDVVLSPAEDAVNVLSDYLLESGLAGLKFLIPKMKGVELQLAERLARAGAVVVELPVYERVNREDGDLPRSRALLSGGAVDEFIFCAADDIQNLRYIFSAGDDVEKLLSGIRISALDESIIKRLRRAGLAASILEQK